MQVNYESFLENGFNGYFFECYGDGEVLVGCLGVRNGGIFIKVWMFF